MLVIGVGNTLRGDDDVGREVAERLGNLVGPPLEVRSVFQLLPELAADLAAARLAVIVDASVDLAPGRVSFSRLVGGGARGGPLGHLTHPHELLDLAAAVFHAAPPTWLVTVGARAFEIGAPLSPEVERAADRVVRRLAPRFFRLSHPLGGEAVVAPRLDNSASGDS